MKNVNYNKIACIIAIIPLFFNLLFSYIYYVIPIFHYKYPVNFIYKDAVIYLLIVTSLLTIIIFLLIKFYKKIYIKIYTFAFIILSMAAFLNLIYIIIDSFNGHSYTTDINNYLITEYDHQYQKYLPENITKDMHDVKYGYFFEDADCHSYEIFLEAKFDNKETAHKYLNETINKIGIKNLRVEDNRYSPNFKTYYLKYSLWDLEDMGDNNYSYTINLFSISYSEEDNILIWNCCCIPGDVFTDDYKSFYFKRFNIDYKELRVEIR